MNGERKWFQSNNTQVPTSLYLSGMGPQTIVDKISNTIDSSENHDLKNEM